MGLGSVAVLNPPAVSGAFSPSSLSPALWIDPSDAASVTISGSSGAYIGANGLVTTGAAAANYATTSTTVPGWNVTGSIDLVVKVALADWTPAANNALIARYGGGVNDLWRFSVATGGGFQLNINGTAYTSTVTNTLTDGQTYYVRARFIAGSPDSTIRFYTSSDGSSWTQLGTDRTATAVTALNTSTASPITVSDLGANIQPTNGTVYRAQFWSGDSTSGGTLLFDADFENATPFVSAFTESALGAPVYVVSSTATSSTASYGYVGPEGWVAPGATGNVATTPDSAAVSPTTAVEIVVRARAAWSNGVVFYAKRSGGAETSAQGSQFYLNSSGSMRFFSNSGDVGVTHALVDGAWYWLKVTADGTATKFYFAADQSTEPVSWTQIGANQAAASFVDTGHLFSIGGDSESGWKPVTIKRLILRKTIGGSADFDADFVTAADYCTTFTESSANAATVTITATNTPSNAAGACVSQINDKSGNARHLTQGTLANMPKYWNGQNGCNCLVFDGADDFMASANLTIAQPVSITVVARMTSSNGQFVTNGSNTPTVYSNSSQWRIFAGVAEVGSSPSDATTPHTFTGIFNGVSSALYKDGASIATGDVGTTAYSAKPFRIGGTTSVWWAGRMGEVVLLASAIGGSDQTNLESYDKSKWGTP